MNKSKLSNYIKNNISTELIYLIPSIIWIIALTMLNYFCSSHVINSDMSAELVLANELSNTNRLFTTQWFYSTEIRIFYTQIISLFLFKLFDSWSLVRALTNLFFFLALLFSYLFAMKPLNLSKKSVYLSSLFLFIPYSLEYINIVHIGNSYMPHFIVIFVCTGLLIRLLENKNKLYFFFYITLSFYAGLCGLRYLTIYAIPIILASILKIVLDNQKANISLFSISVFRRPILLIPLLGCVTSLIGAFFNSKVLTKTISVGSTNDLLISRLDDVGVINMLDSIIVDLLRLFGYYDFTALGTFEGIASIASVVIFVTLVIISIIIAKNYNRFDEKKQYFIVLFLMSLFTNTFIFMFIAGTYVPRFYMPTLILLTPYIAMFINEKALIKYDFNKLVAIFLVIAVNISGISTCYTCIKNDQNAPFKDVVNFLEENNLTFGLTTFWNTGVVNELSNGRIECVNIKDSDITQVYEWLTFKKYLNSETWKSISCDRIFLLLDSDIYETFEQTPMVQAGSFVYDEDGYIILVYDKNQFIENFGNQYFRN